MEVDTYLGNTRGPRVVDSEGLNAEEILAVGEAARESELVVVLCLNHVSYPAAALLQTMLPHRTAAWVGRSYRTWATRTGRCHRGSGPSRRACASLLIRRSLVQSLAPWRHRWRWDLGDRQPETPRGVSIRLKWGDGKDMMTYSIGAENNLIANLGVEDKGASAADTACVAHQVLGGKV